jgi:(1->4)-alpha-D-glucan 1-alpha-D-glucosylmutase
LIARALSEARRRNPALERSVFEFLRDALLPSEGTTRPLDEELRRAFVLKFQQCTGPITAKGVEDSAFYVYNRLVALNEVGGDPGQFGGSIEDFHRKNAARAEAFPHSLLATSTHDTKRSEDVRARLAALSEMPHEWARVVRRWRTANQRHRPLIELEHAPDANEEFLLYQTLLGSWPLAPMDPDARAAYIERIQEYMMKALHEAKVNTSWIEPNEAWDKAVREFVAKILTPARANRFLAAFEPFARRIAEIGSINALTQQVLKLTAPGVPDIYQGTELWDFSLVDPDNRRPVDYEHREQQLRALGARPSAAELLEHWEDSRIKLFVTRELLQFRRTHAELFSTGGYQALDVTGDFAASAVAYSRSTETEQIIVVVPRLSSRVGWPPIGAAWRDTALPLEVSQGRWRDLFTEREHTGSLPLATIFADFPVAVLVEQQ